MPEYRELCWAATGLQTEIGTLEEFCRKGWIKTVEKNGTTYIGADQQYRARFILHLRNKLRLSDEQIDLVLKVQKPPYSAAGVLQLLQGESGTKDGKAVG